MQIINTLILLHIFTFILLFTLTISSSPAPSPSPSPLHSPSSQTLSPSQSPIQQSGSSDYAFPDPSSPSPALSDISSSPAPAGPTEASDIGEMKGEEQKDSSDKGMSGGKKVGVAFGLIAAACFVGFGGVLYRKRQDNIRRARYSQSARLEFF